MLVSHKMMTQQQPLKGIMDIIELFLRYAILPLLGVICTGGWFMYKKHDERLDSLERRTQRTEVHLVEIQTSFRYVSESLQEIKEDVKKLVARRK